MVRIYAGRMLPSNLSSYWFGRNSAKAPFVVRCGNRETADSQRFRNCFSLRDCGVAWGVGNERISRESSPVQWLR